MHYMYLSSLSLPSGSFRLCIRVWVSHVRAIVQPTKAPTRIRSV